MTGRRMVAIGVGALVFNLGLLYVAVKLVKMAWGN